MASPVFGYRPSRKLNFIPSGSPVTVIASFKKSGDFIPLYFQVEDTHGERFRYKIASIDSIKDKTGVKIFVCGFMLNGCKQAIVLQFELDMMRWLVG